MKTIESTETEKAKLVKKLRAIQEIENRELAEVHYPEIKEKYEGKFFKRVNSFSDNHTWIMYEKVVSISKEDVYPLNKGVTSYFKGFSLQLIPESKTGGKPFSLQITKISHGYIHGLGEEISEQEFKEAWGKGMEYMNSLI